MKAKESRSNIILNETLFALYVLDIWGVNGHHNRKNESQLYRIEM